MYLSDHNDDEYGIQEREASEVFFDRVFLYFPETRVVLQKLIMNDMLDLHRFYTDEAQKFEHSWEKVDPRYPEKPLISLLNPEKTVNEKTRTRKPAKFGRFRVFQENYELWREKILDPGGDIFLQWNRVFLFFCILSLFVDPLFFYTPAVVSNGDSSCMTNDLNLGIVITCFRTLADIFYVLHIVVKFQTAYVSPISRVFGRGELVTDRKMIAKRYLKSDFIIDLVAALPLPQIVLWFILPAVKSSHSDHTNNALVLIVLIQYFPRLYLIFPLSTQIIKSAGVVTRTAWAGAAYNLLLYMLASHVLGASWYLLSMERHATCWKTVCKKEFSPVKCRLRYLDCGSLGTVDRLKWENSTLLFNNCDPDNESAIFNYGIFGDAVTKTVVSLNFIEKYFYCLWWGLQNLSSYGQNLATSTSLWETLFAILIAILGLVLFAHLIGNMQTYLQSLTVRLEEWRLKQRDTEEWMKHRQLPQDLRQRVRHYVQYKWLATRGVDEESILQALPTVLRRDIQRHLCLDLVRRVPFFSQMDDQLLDAICERLASSLSTQGTYLVREGDPVTEMLFIIRGRLESTTTNGGRSGFFNSIILKPGDFCGEELLSWALLPKSTLNLPTSTRTVRALDEVEAFALQAEELKFVANQFRRLHSKKLQHTFRYYSHQWRTWGACFIQAAWRRHKKKRMEKNLVNMESFSSSFDEQTKLEEEEENDASSASSNTKQNLGITILASRFAANTRRGAQRTKDVLMPKLQKPEEPDFGMVADDD